MSNGYYYKNNTKDNNIFLKEGTKNYLIVITVLTIIIIAIAGSFYFSPHNENQNKTIFYTFIILCFIWISFGLYIYNKYTEIEEEKKKIRRRLRKKLRKI